MECSRLNESVLNDDLFNECLDRHDIVILTETWLKEDVAIRGDLFYNFHNIRQKKKNAIRASGGISVLIRHDMRKMKDGKGVTILTQNDYCVWFKLSGKCFNLRNDIYFCACYVPHEGSSFYRNNEIDPFREIEKGVC